MTVCLICLNLNAPDSPELPYHRTCLENLFGTNTAPAIHFGRADVPDIVERSVSKF